MQVISITDVAASLTELKTHCTMLLFSVSHSCDLNVLVCSVVSSTDYNCSKLNDPFYQFLSFHCHCYPMYQTVYYIFSSLPS